ncbi:MAG TPA: DUF58 domain-containing protein [Chitinophagaceae bacterium]|nr:DUF58 domain-containing protein [Chitinophagaceae bacterium]
MNIFYSTYLKPLFFGRRFFLLLVGVILLFILSYWFDILFGVAEILLLFLGILVTVDYLVLFGAKNGLELKRIVPESFSNGDENKVQISIRNKYRFPVSIKIIDEVPVQFQQRNFKILLKVKEGEETLTTYSLRPVERGEHFFNDINAFTRSPLRLVSRRIKMPSQQMVKVLPSYIQLRQYELKAHSSNLAEAGSKRMRKLGHSLEFEQIKEYVRGDDIRTIHWKATARKGQLMVNNYTDERSQQVYCVIDKGRVMKMPFEGMTLLDYAINATLILSSVALIKQDRAGIITFAEQIGNVLVADKKAGQMNHVLELLYRQQTHFLETDFEKLYGFVRTRITQRSLLVLFTNFESLSGLQRQLPYIRSLAKQHLLLVVFFENTELRQLTETQVDSMEDLYIKTIAERFAYEKRLIVRELQQHGITTILTAPQNLTINTVNKYLELKARRAI